MTQDLDPDGPESLIQPFGLPSTDEVFGTEMFSLGTDVDALMGALHQCAAHAADMQSSEADYHDDCRWCETMKLLARCVGFGDQLRAAERRRLAK